MLKEWKNFKFFSLLFCISEKKNFFLWKEKVLFFCLTEKKKKLQNKIEFDKFNIKKNE